MKTEYEYGELYAEWVLNQKPFGELCNMDYNKCHPDIPSGDYREMQRDGIANPDARDYWNGFNDKIREVT
jgi:hypothetical protein